MTLEELIQQKVDRIDNIPKEFLTSVEKEQKVIFKEVLKRIDVLDRINGKIVLNDRNLRLINEIGSDLNKIVANSKYKDLVKGFIKEFDTQNLITDNIYKISIENYKKTQIADKIVTQFKLNTAERFIGNHALTQEFSTPLKDIMLKAVVNESSYVDTVMSIKDIIEGDSERLGKLRRYSGQIAWDSMAQMDRTYSKVTAENNGVEFYRYVGGTVKDSRDFCVERTEEYFHKNEIEGWASLDWGGKIPNTTKDNIFTNAGGYRCQHSFIGLGLSRVPKDVILRNIKNGNVTLSEAQKKILKL
jgi:hypothetical protein